MDERVLNALLNDMGKLLDGNIFKPVNELKEDIRKIKQSFRAFKEDIIAFDEYLDLIAKLEDSIEKFDGSLDPLIDEILEGGNKNYLEKIFFQQ